MAGTLKRVFWNADEGRLRAGWRLLGQIVILLVLFLLLTVLLTALLGALPVLIGFASPIVAVGLVFAPSVASVWLAGRLLDRRPFADFGFHLSRGWWLDFGFGLLLAALLITLAFLVQWAAGWVAVVGAFETDAPGQPFAVAILASIALFTMVGIQEELLIRGYQLHNLAEGLNLPSVGPRAALVVAWLISSVVFGLLHSTNPNATLLSTVNLIVAGLFLGLGYILTGELAIPIGLHIAWNFVQGNVFGFPVSGARLSQTTFIAVQELGPDLWTGGAFGPEGGLLILPIMLVGSALIVLWVRYRYGGVALAMSIPEPPTGVTARRRIAAEPGEATRGESGKPAA